MFILLISQIQPAIIVFAKLDKRGFVYSRVSGYFRDIMQKVGQYEIEVYRDETFEEGSADNLHKYDFEYFEKSEFVLTTTVRIKIFKDKDLLKSAIIGAVGGGAGIHRNSIIYEDARVVVCCSDSIFCLSVPDLTLLWQTHADQATCFEIFKYKDSYIVHGELQISRLDKDGKILWQEGGADIFTTMYGVGPDFELTENFIIAKDFESRIYKFDYDGNSFTDMTQFS